MELDSHIFAARSPGKGEQNQDSFPIMHFRNFPGLDAWMRQKWDDQGKPLFNSSGTLVKYAETEDETEWFHKYLVLGYEDLLDLEEAMELNRLDYTGTTQVDEKINDLRSALNISFRAFPYGGPVLYTSTLLEPAHSN